MNALGPNWTEADIERLIARDEPEALREAVIALALNPPECGWAQEMCLRLSAHGDAYVRGNSVLGFGHLARLCGALDEARVRPVVAAALADESAYVRGQAHAAASDIDFFLGWAPKLLDEEDPPPLPD